MYNLRSFLNAEQISIPESYETVFLLRKYCTRISSNDKWRNTHLTNAWLNCNKITKIIRGKGCPKTTANDNWALGQRTAGRTSRPTGTTTCKIQFWYIGPTEGPILHSIAFMMPVDAAQKKMMKFVPTIEITIRASYPDLQIQAYVLIFINFSNTKIIKNIT